MAKDKFEKKDDELTEEEKRRKNIGSGVGGVLGMLPTIAGAIPTLRKSRERDALKKMQQGGGAGATAARQAGAAAGRATAGNLGGRGSSGLVREGLRSAERQTAEGISQAALIGAQEGQRGTQLLLENERLRRQAGLQLGAGLGGTVATAIAGGLAGRDQGPTEDTSTPLKAGEGIADTTSGAWMDQGQSGQNIGSVFGTESGRAFGQAPSLDVNTTLAAPAEQPAVPNVPQTQLQEPQVGAPQGSEGFALQSMVNPQAGFDQAELAYQANVMKKKDRPLRSRGGSDEQYLQQDLMKYEEYLMGLIEQGLINPAMVPQLLEKYVADRGGM